MDVVFGSLKENETKAFIDGFGSGSRQFREFVEEVNCWWVLSLKIENGCLVFFTIFICREYSKE